MKFDPKPTPLMFSQLLHHPFLKITAILLGAISVAAAKPKSDGKAQLRIVCASSLSENHEVVLALRDEKGRWRELAPVKLRSSLITAGLPAQAGELHLAVMEEGSLKSICQFSYPADARRALAVLVADPEQNSYAAHVVDPEKTGFIDGSLLIFNFSPHTGVVLLGAEEETVEAGEKKIAKPPVEGNGMYRMMVSYLDAEGTSVGCYDRQVPRNPDSRQMLFLLPDETLGLKVISLPLFGLGD
jgi:hypothetical protein